MLDRDKVNITNSEVRILLAIYETLETMNEQLKKLGELLPKEKIETKKTKVKGDNK